MKGNGRRSGDGREKSYPPFSPPFTTANSPSPLSSSPHPLPRHPRPRLAARGSRDASVVFRTRSPEIQIPD